MEKNWVTGFVLVLIWALCGNWAMCADSFWNATEGTWETEANWSGGLPGVDTLVYLGNSGVVTAAGPINVAALTIGYATPGTNAGVGSLTSLDSLTVGSLYVGHSESGSLVVGSAETPVTQVTIGTGDSSLFNAGVCSTNGDDNNRRSATVDFSNVSNVGINVSEMSLLYAAENTNTGLPNVSVTLGQNNTITAGSLKMGTTFSPNLIGTSSSLVLGDTNTLKIDNILVGGDKSQGSNDVTIKEGGTVAISGRAEGAKSSLYISYSNTVTTTSNSSKGNVDFSNAGTVTMALSDLTIGYLGNGSSADSKGTLNAGNSATITADTVSLGTVAPINSGKTTGNLIFGGTLTVAGDFVMGNHATRSFSNLTMNAGSTLSVGGSLNSQGKATITMNAGSTLSVAGSFDMQDKITLTMSAGSTLKVGGLFSAQGKTFSFGLGSGDSSLQVTGDVKIGTGTQNFNVAHAIAPTVASISTSVDFSGAQTVEVNVVNLNMGYYNPSTQAQVTLLLGKDNTISANNILMSTSQSNNMSKTYSSLVLGAENKVNVDTFIVGGLKGEGDGTRCASVTIVEGGNLLLQGKSGTLANLNIGYDEDLSWTVTATTGNSANGSVDLSNAGKVEMYLDTLRIGYDKHSSTSSTKTSHGTLLLGGTDTLVEANTLDIAIHDCSGKGKVNGILTIGENAKVVVHGAVRLGNKDALSTAVLNLEGGELVADEISIAGANSAININSGTLGIKKLSDGYTQNKDIIFNPGGTLAVGTTTVIGDCNIEAGSIILEVLAGGYDTLKVTENLALVEGSPITIDIQDKAGLQENMTFITVGNADMPDITPIWTGIAAQNEMWKFGWYQNADADWEYRVYTGIPEPSTWLLLLLGALGLGYWKRRA